MTNLRKDPWLQQLPFGRTLEIISQTSLHYLLTSDKKNNQDFVTKFAKLGLSGVTSDYIERYKESKSVLNKKEYWKHLAQDDAFMPMYSSKLLKSIISHDETSLEEECLRIFSLYVDNFSFEISVPLKNVIQIIANTCLHYSKSNSCSNFWEKSFAAEVASVSTDAFGKCLQLFSKFLIDSKFSFVGIKAVHDFLYQTINKNGGDMWTLFPSNLHYLIYLLDIIPCEKLCSFSKSESINYVLSEHISDKIKNCIKDFIINDDRNMIAVMLCFFPWWILSLENTLEYRILFR